jgi:hypothetical protein
MNDYGVVLFHTNSSAMRAEKTLLRYGLAIRLIPTPRQYSSDCGIALRFDWSQRDTVCDFLTAARVEIAGLHPLPM